MKLRVLNHIHRVLYDDYMAAHAKLDEAEKTLGELIGTYDAKAMEAKLRMLNVPTPEMELLTDRIEDARQERNAAKECFEDAEEAVKAFANAEWGERG